MLSNWPIAFYYVAAELWGTYSLVVLFWQVANELFTPSEATESFPLFIFISSISIIIASFVLELLSLTQDPLVTCTLTICSIGCAMMLIVFALSRIYAPCFENSYVPKQSSKKKRPSFADGLSLTLTSPHVFYIGVCVFSFGMLVNFFELSLDHKLSLYYDNPKLLLEFQSWFTRAKGLLCILANVINAFMLRRMGWFAVAMVTPCICILSANLFLFSCYHIEFLQTFIPQAASAEEFLVWIGCILLVLTYTCKYSFFDTTKELAFTPLPDTMKANAKAVADGICGRAGKSGSSLVQACLISITAAQTVPDIIPYLMYLGALLSVFWIWSMFQLNKSYQAKIAAFIPDSAQDPQPAYSEGEASDADEPALEPSAT